MSGFDVCLDSVHVPCGAVREAVEHGSAEVVIDEVSLVYKDGKLYLVEHCPDGDDWEHDITEIAKRHCPDVFGGGGGGGQG